MSTQEAIDYAYSVAAAGAGASCIVKFSNPLPISDILSQVLTMKVISDNIASIYGFKSVPGLTGFTMKLIGAGGGVKLASEVMMPIPIIGLGASTVAAFCIQMAASIAFIIIFELRKKGTLPNDYLKRASPMEIAYLIRLAVEAGGEIALGKDQVEAISAAVAKFEDAVV
ncbi:hypothetical protein [Candidatus Oscillochloris fontis]|uniref:hypothetical protein n=1 Tax=Candidatus Oscillochloris fontis TaxID=2496868 RepID=UPI00101D232C|nr:hypothetical protein [Candidatus Oscillochloris fontis]